MPHIKKSYFVTTESIDFFPLAHDIASALKEAAVTDGVVYVVVPNGGAGLLVFKNSAETRAKIQDIIHAELLQRSIAIPVIAGVTVLGHHEDVILVDCQPRVQRREVIVCVVADAGAGKAEK